MTQEQKQLLTVTLTDGTIIDFHVSSDFWVEYNVEEGEFVEIYDDCLIFSIRKEEFRFLVYGDDTSITESCELEIGEDEELSEEYDD